MPCSFQNPLKHTVVRLLLSAMVVICAQSYCAAADDAPLSNATFTDGDNRERTVEGRILVTAQDGGILLLGRDGRLWNITPDKLVETTKTDEAFRPLSSDKLAAQLRQEFGDSFEIVKTRHYTVCTNAGAAYARWCGALFERLMSAFRTHWRTRALKLHDPRLPLIAIVFANAKEFAEFANKDAGPAAAGAKGYYSIRTNRIVLYDLTADSNSKPATTTAEVNRKISASLFSAATVVHEATHQIAFNCGMHTRYADNPLWLSEGMAMYFETPDLASRNGWRTVGKVNPARLARFRDYARKRRRSDSLNSLLTSNNRFADAENAEDTYAEAWALNYFLIKTRRKQYIDYLSRLAGKQALVWDDPAQRQIDFQKSFGKDIDSLDQQFLRFIGRLGR